MDTYSNRIIATVTHHLHCFYQQNPYMPASQYNNKPFYLTVNAGHCTSHYGDQIYPNEFLKFDFELNGDLDNKDLNIINLDSASETAKY